jgi:prepilin-type processing-associated H-X9-DG protein
MRDYDAEPQIPPFDPTKPWNDVANLALGRFRAGAFVCPANFNRVDEMQRHYSAYAAVTGPDTAFPDGQALPVAKFIDGTSNTIVYGEAAGLRIVWTEPRDIDISREPIGINLPGKGRSQSPGTLSSYHSGGAVVVFADGHVRFISNGINSAVLKALLTATGGEPLPDESY